MSEKVAYSKDSPEGKALIAEKEKVIISQNNNKPVSEPVNDHIETQSEIEPPFSAYEKIKGKPYSAEFFKITEWDMLNDDLDIDKKKDKVKLIESWIKEKIEGSNLEDSLEAYRELMKRYFDELNIGKTEKNSSKLERVYLYLKLAKKQSDLDRRRREIIDNRI